VIQVLWSMEQALEDLDIRPNEGHGVAAVVARLSGEAAPAPV
jgi:hypothetical protein